MPELPDIELYLAALDDRLTGEVLERVRVASPFVVRSYDPPMKEAEGRKLLGLRRMGKRIVFCLEGELFLVLHLMIAGRLRYEPRGKAVPKKVGLAAFDFADATLLLTEASKKKRASLHLVTGEEALEAHDPGGLEVLHASLEDFSAALVADNHTLKRTLTDPHVLSGIGNAYSDEILHRAKLSPLKWTQRLDSGEIARLHACTQAVLREWTERLKGELDGGFPKKVTAFRPAMAVHGKYRQPCPDCGTKVQRIVRGESEVNYCPTCQTGGKLLADRALSRLLRGDWPKSLEELEERKAKLSTESGSDDEARRAGRGASTDRPEAGARGKSAKRSTGRKKSRKGASKNDRPLILFAHGAGLASSSDWMQAWRQRLESMGTVVTFDYPYMREGRKRPDRHEKLVAAHHAALAEAAKNHGGPIVLAGKSMGSRIGCHVALEANVQALVCLGYPLVSAGKKKTVRSEVLRELTTPILFVQGTRDRMCPLETLEQVRAEIRAPSALHVVEAGDHSLRATKTWLRQHDRTQEEVDARAAEAIAAFLEAHL